MRATTILNALVFASVDRPAMFINQDPNYERRVRQFAKFYNWLVQYLVKVEKLEWSSRVHTAAMSALMTFRSGG